MNKRKIRIVTSIISVLICSLFLIQSYAFTGSSDDSVEINNINRELWWWSDLELITEDSTISSLRVSIDIDSDDNIHVSWTDYTDYDSCGTDGDIFYRKWSKETKVWSTVEVVSTESTGYSDTSIIVVDRFSNIHVVWMDATALDEPGIDYDVFYKMKDASTGTWTSTEIVSSSSLDNSHAPDIDVDSFGNVHVVWHDYHDYDGTDIDVIYKVRDFTSGTWSAVTIISSESTDVSQVAKIAVDSNDYVHVIWQDYTSNLYNSGADRDIFYKRWDSVNLWSEGLALSYESDGYSYEPFIEVDITNSIHVVWTDGSDIEGSGTDRDIFYRKWDRYSSTWTPLTIISTMSDTVSFISTLTIDSYLNIHFVWSEFEDYGGSGIDCDVFYRYLDSETNALSSTSVISSSSTLESYYPQILSDSLDYLHVLWYDYDDLLGSGIDPDVFYKKFIGTPAAPNLAEIPNTGSIGNITLNWNPSVRADEYNIYRSNSYIWDSSDLELLTTVSDNSYSDNILEVGVCYYTVIASNEYGDSAISNIVSIEVTESSGSGLFSSLDWGEIIILGGFLGALQIIFAIVIVVTKSASKPSSSSKKGKKK